MNSPASRDSTIKVTPLFRIDEDERAVTQLKPDSAESIVSDSARRITEGVTNAAKEAI